MKKTYKLSIPYLGKVAVVTVVSFSCAISAYQLSQNSSDMVRAGAFLLLGKIDVAQFIIQQFPEDEKTRFMEFPIAIFIKGTNCWK